MADLRWNFGGKQLPFGRRQTNRSAILNSPAHDYAQRILIPQAQKRIERQREISGPLQLNIRRVYRP